MFEWPAYYLIRFCKIKYTKKEIFSNNTTAEERYIYSIFFFFAKRLRKTLETSFRKKSRLRKDGFSESRDINSYYFNAPLSENKIVKMERHCDKCNLEVLRGTVLTTLCVDGAAHHLVDNIVSGISVLESSC